MKIAFDLRWIRSKNIDGISRYTMNLVSHLLERDKENEYLLIGDDAILRHHFSEQVLASLTIQSISPRLLSAQDFLRSPREIDQLRIDLLHVPNYLHSPFGGTYKKILTVYDLIPFLFPDALSQSRRLWRWFYKTPYPARAILSSADTIITTSENTKRDMMRLLRIPAERIRVVWSGIERRFCEGIRVPDTFWTTYQLPPRFLLYVGRQDPYKGLTYLVRAYALLPRPLRQRYHLVIAGKRDPRYIGEVEALSKEFQLDDSIHFLDYVPDQDLPFLYSAASLLLHPSLYEGFGLPPLEAMACATPVVYADTSSLTELIGDAGFAVAPASAEALAQGIRTMLENESLRTGLIEKGRRHVQRYSWQQVAREMLQIYNTI